MDQVVRLREARKAVESAALKLQHATPESVDECRAKLEAAVQSLADLHAVEAGSMAAMELRALERSIDHVRRLLQQAAEFYMGWASMLSVAAAGYGPHGEAARPLVSSRVLVEG